MSSIDLLMKIKSNIWWVLTAYSGSPFQIKWIWVACVLGDMQNLIIRKFSWLEGISGSERVTRDVAPVWEFFFKRIDENTGQTWGPMPWPLLHNCWREPFLWSHTHHSPIRSFSQSLHQCYWEHLTTRHHGQGWHWEKIVQVPILMGLISLEDFCFLTQKANAAAKWTSWPFSEVSNCTWDKSNKEKRF